ncbi:Hypothetical predicted protein, partial [Pelobates cultripes]
GWEAIVCAHNTRSEASKMVDAPGLATRGLQQQKHDFAGPSTAAMDPLEVFFERYWAQRLECTRQATSIHKPLQREEAHMPTDTA